MGDTLKRRFREILQTEKEHSLAIVTLRTLIECLQSDKSETVVELRKNIRAVIEALKDIEPATEVESVSEIYFRFITLKVESFDVIQELRKELVKQSDVFLNKVINCRSKVAKNGHPFVSDGSTILIHGKSRAVFYTLCEAANYGKRFKVFVTESCPDRSGEIMSSWLSEKGIPNTLILDAAVGYFMEKVDLVLTGAEGVAESGGIINKIGTFPVAVCAKVMNKPFYVLAESYKFIRIFPLNQNDIPERLKHRIGAKKSETPLVDYTPPSYITLLLTDLGTLTTAAVSDQLLQLYL